MNKLKEAINEIKATCRDLGKVFNKERVKELENDVRLMILLMPGREAILIWEDYEFKYNLQSEQYEDNDEEHKTLTQKQLIDYCVGAYVYSNYFDEGTPMFLRERKEDVQT